MYNKNREKSGQVSFSQIIVGAIGLVVLVVLVIIFSSQINFTSNAHNQRYESLASLQECQALYQRAEAAERTGDTGFLTRTMLELKSGGCYNYEVGFDWTRERKIIFNENPFYLYFDSDGNLILRNFNGDTITLDKWLLKNDKNGE